MKVFLTGGTGLLGSHAAALLRGRGHQVVALCRPSSDDGFLRAAGCRVVRGDVEDPPDRLAPLMGGCSHVVHAAALVYTGGAWPLIRAVNAEGTRHVMEAAARAGVGHAVHISSVAVYGSVEGPGDEDRPTDTPIPPGDLYARSKRAAESAARAVEDRGGLSLTVLRPSGVYGERDRLMAPRVARMVRFPVAFLLGDGQNTVPAVYAGNVAAAIVLALEAGRGNATWDVGLDHPLTQRALLRGIARGMGRSPTFVPLPAGLVRKSADLLERVGISAPGAEHLPLGRVARLAMGENPYPSGRIREELGWDPPHRPEEALERTGRWLEEAEKRET
ncbi:MAG: NAD(P)-dependent oxidoreductase [Gemmatimonadota bacterium]